MMAAIVHHRFEQLGNRRAGFSLAHDPGSMFNSHHCEFIRALVHYPHTNPIQHRRRSQNTKVSYELQRRFVGLEQTEYAQLTPMQWVRLYDDVILELEGYLTQSYGRMIGKLMETEAEEARAHRK